MNSQTKNITLKDDQKAEIRNEWFGELIHGLNVDKDSLSMDIANEQTKQFYDRLIFGNMQDTMSDLRDTSTQFFIGKLVYDYIKEIRSAGVGDIKLYLDHNDSALFVWAVINDDDEGVEMALLKAEAKVNAENYMYGFHISSTITEKSDRFPVPPHYENIII